MPYSDELDFAPLRYILAALNIGEKDEKHLKKIRPESFRRPFFQRPRPLSFRGCNGFRDVTDEPAFHNT